ncbi:MAG: hypothetical protein A3B89_00640 [Candidatus Buchananbacteria bacterium RIFCSPHIGHO2_02_FULL_40_13]|uniref:site-specific DNA-methyltransferase (adenine-specific) n=1 Tax=Candidatus Buchananbacteria bacterium RIFCSPLOWO2_01_FULL_39_33 TaxID=1797543 RepID=A0A1G1YGQ7_9BACT|nr:MAG: hypothetical protein A2820_03295 [Candidatus Buchananbacteria bacterium RIFCSPHIGHO2_01_FULL_40_35]OGY50383.1 MAG: hypothetical protein A3B89_00640 [Candidatus Buchananbacteria bacterium RIFCSPHIGHO2_02_FULL_40_13]OGY51522.1 MAG: hypothetical protein A3A02_01800 [Candidatus Buchananbacteria bacterium RIFCSPLOWO2_01_FULL_39_33]
MNLNISQLKSKWDKEKTSYTKKEIGDGVQIFVKEVLQSPEIFNLKRGLNSTSLEKRRNEFKEEEKKKAARHADVVIFIDADIVIPMEIEKYQNIKVGEKQIIQYQLDWNENSNRRYGILTDGDTWRFYNNNEYREFTLAEIFNKTDLFLEFWQEYIKPEFYYLAFFEKKGQKSLFKEAEILHVEEYRQIFFEDITKLIRSFKNKINIEGYLSSLDKKGREKRAVELTYAYIIQFILYKTLVDNEFGKFKKDFMDRQGAIYDALKSRQYKGILSIIEGISQTISGSIYHPFKKEQDFINQTLVDLIHQPKNELHEVSPWLDIFVFIKKYNFANVRNEIFGYIYENYLKELYEDTKKGQYFTDPAVVDFMLDVVGYTAKEVKNSLYYDRYGERGFDNHISIIDPSCGCGTFLYSAVDRIIAGTGYGSEKASRRLEHLISQSVFGLDIEEFPLYLAEMNVLMRMLPMILHKEYINPVDEKIKVFKTNDSVAEFLDTAIKNTINDIDVAYQKNNGQISLFTEKLNLGYVSYVRDEGDLSEMKKSLENHAIPRRRFDFVIGNPPYVAYNECSKQNVLIFELMKRGKVKLNDIYGVNLHSIPSRQKKYSPKPNLYAFFIALGIALLKDGAKICYIVPQTLLTAGDLDVLRYHLAKFTTIEKIITFSGKMFLGRGLKQDKPVATSSLIFVIKRATPDSLHQVDITHYKNSNDDINKCLANIKAGKKIVRKKILQGKLLQNVSNWNFIKQDRDFLDFYEEYKNSSEDISIYYNHATADHYFKSRFYFDGGGNINEAKITNEDKNSFEIFNYRNNIYDNFKICRGLKFYPKSESIIFPQGSQGKSVFLQKYKIIWRTKEPKIFQYCDRDIILVGNQSLTITSNNKIEVFYLIALLNSKIIKILLLSNLKLENEQSYLLPITGIKEFVRVPKITKDNQFIKDEIIKRTDEILALEDIKLADLVDFSQVMMQKFDQVAVEDDNLILIKDDKKMKYPILKDKNLVADAIRNRYFNGKLFKDKQISLAELKDSPMINFERQKKIKDYLDDLVFALYFKASIKKIGLEKAGEIKLICQQNKFYKILEKSNYTI